jgi:hypothetical protein
MCSPLIAAEDRVAVEVVFANQSPSYASGASLDWWAPDKYDTWQTFDESSFDLAEARLLITGETYTAVFGMESYPDIRAEGTYEDPVSGGLVLHDLTGEIAVFDAALGQFSSRGDSYWIPWFGLTHMKIDGVRTASIDGSAPIQPRDESSSRLWGVVFGVAGSYEVAHRLSVTGRAVVRWAKGTRDATFFPADSPGDPEVGQVETSDSVSRAMWGLEAGLSWAAVGRFSVEGGWRYRDWQYDDGPVSFGGLYARLSLAF